MKSLSLNNERGHNILRDSEGTSLSCRITSDLCRGSSVRVQLADFWLCDLSKLKTFWLQEEWICHAAKQTEDFSKGICLQSKWNFLWFSWPVEEWEQHWQESCRVGSKQFKGRYKGTERAVIWEQNEKKAGDLLKNMSCSQNLQLSCSKGV